MADALVVEFVPAVDRPAPAPRLTRSGVPRKQRIDLMAEPRRCEFCHLLFFKSSQYSGHLNSCTRERPWDGMPNRKRNTELVGAISAGTATRKRVKVVDPESGALRTVTTKVGHPHDGIEGAGGMLPRLRIAARTDAPVVSNLLMSRQAPVDDALVCMASSDSRVLDLALLLEVPTSTAAAAPDIPDRAPSPMGVSCRGLKRARTDSSKTEAPQPCAKRPRIEPSPLQSTPAGTSATPLAERIYNAESVEDLEGITHDINESIAFLRRARAVTRELAASAMRRDTQRVIELALTPRAPETPQSFA
jgi:hypothetical protein